MTRCVSGYDLLRSLCDILIRSKGFAKSVGRSSTRYEIHRQRHLRLHQRVIFRPHACRRNSGCYRTEWARDLGEGTQFVISGVESADMNCFCAVQAIKVIDNTQRWGARVVYGDTDSLFIYLKGKTKDQAFRIGHDIADTITRMNPAPVKLKFEKVLRIFSTYHACILTASYARFICLVSC